VGTFGDGMSLSLGETRLDPRDRAVIADIPTVMRNHDSAVRPNREVCRHLRAGFSYPPTVPA
jgi:hypothetical protein